MYGHSLLSGILAAERGPKHTGVLGSQKECMSNLQSLKKKILTHMHGYSAAVKKLNSLQCPLSPPAGSHGRPAGSLVERKECGRAPEHLQHTVAPCCSPGHSCRRKEGRGGEGGGGGREGEEEEGGGRGGGRGERGRERGTLARLHTATCVNS